MSNETDLDWLARNVHVCVPNELLRVKPCDNGNVTFRTSWCYSGDGGFTKDQWLSRRAELQNKPSWEDAPEWAEYMSQSPNGHWEFFSAKPIADSWWRHSLDVKSKANDASNPGLILGDWRDTLEKRPEQLKPSIEEANRLAQEFKLLTGIEDNQEQDMKQDNKWFERGELPPVGTECEIDLGAKWRKAFVVGRNYTGRIVVEVDTCDFIVADGCTFRPIRTERDELLAVIVEEMNHYDTDGKLADAILAAGFSLRDK